MKNQNSHIWIIIFMIILTVVLVGGAVFFLQQNSIKELKTEIQDLKKTITEESSSDEQTATPITTTDTNPIVTTKPAMESGVFENDKLSFGLTFGYELVVKEVADNKVEIFEKDNPERLASVEWYTDGEEQYENYAIGLSRGGYWHSYMFPEADKGLSAILDVKVLDGGFYGGIYAITWKENYGNDFVIVEFDNTGKSSQVAWGIMHSVKLK